jgi:isoquinoline 1-oxidoreductase beta subunit
MTASFRLNPFVSIGTDGTVTVTVNKSEMGQGVYTALPMLVAEELECDVDGMRVEAAPVGEVYRHTVFPLQLTGGSTSVWSEWERMLKAGAQAREMLKEAAAGAWNVDKASCRAEKGRITHPSGKALTYGELAERASRLAPPEDIRLKDPSSFTVVGKARRRLDSPDKVNGKAVFGIDLMLPGMLTCVITRSPFFGGTLRSFKGEKAKGMPGVRHIMRVASGVAVVADTFWTANLARRTLECDWDEGPLGKLSTPRMKEEYKSLAQTPGATAKKEGDPEKALEKAAKRVEADYALPYLAHAPMEPLNCLVDLRESTCDVWVGTQFQSHDRESAARVAGLDPDRVNIHTTLLGGGFGRRANPQSDFVVEAVEVAKAVGKPVKVVWTREDDTRGGYYRPMAHHRLAAGLDEAGNLVAWQQTIVGQSIMKGTPFEAFMEKDGVDETSVEGAKELAYDIPNVLVDLHTVQAGPPVLWWRSVGHSHTAFVVESFVDEIAHAAGKDPFEFRRGLLENNPRQKALLELAAEKAGWGTPLPEGRARGIATHKSFESFVAQVAEVSVSSDGTVHVHRVVCAVDCGRVVNPATIEAQMEGAIVMGLSAVLYGQITFKDGRVEQGNFHDYPILHINEMPVVEVHILPSLDAPGGAGEPGLPPLAPAVTNAIFALTGKRIRELPIKKENLKAQ